MSLKLRLVSKKLGSKSLKLLQEGLSTKLGYHVWRSSTPKLKRENLLYGDCKNKIEQYQFFQQNSLPALAFTMQREEAKEWASTGIPVVCRTLTRASEGKGIVIAETPEAVVLAPVYTQYKKKKKEFILLHPL